MTVFAKLASLGGLAMIAAASQAHAADIYPGGGGSLKDVPPAYIAPAWQGFYAGVNGGYGSRANSGQFGYAGCSSCDPAFGAYGGIGADGGFGGGQIGYNWQGIFGNPAIVLGIEADIQGSGISGKATDPYAEHFKTDLDWFGTLRGRLGYAAGNALIYATGGFAYGGLKQHAEDNYYSPPTAYYLSNDTVTGYVVGGGVEYKFNPAWSLKLEYQYLDFGRNNPGTTADAIGAGYGATAAADGFRIQEDAYHTVRVGLNYHIASVYEPLK
jgi:outer membrane immunogenic protein